MSRKVLRGWVAIVAFVKPVRFFTQAEASAVVAAIEPRVRRLREAYERFAECGQHLEDMTIVYGPAAKDPAGEAYDEWMRYSGEAELLRAEVQQLVDEIQAAGAQVKDPAIGLLDFYAKRGEEVVFLCWRLGEDKVEHWHSLTDGFLGRKAIAQVDLR